MKNLTWRNTSEAKVWFSGLFFDVSWCVERTCVSVQVEIVNS